MDKNNSNNRFIYAIRCLPQSLSKLLTQHIEKIGGQVQEIRLRVNRPLCMVCPGVTYYLTANGCLTSTLLNAPMLTVSRSEINDVFHNICNYSVYSRQNEIINGFITMQGGHRAGICGTAVVGDGKITNVRDISSINIRISREHRGCCEGLLKNLGNINGGVLVCGAPCSGKTTVLRDIARIISLEYSKNVALIDERGELAGTSFGVFQNDIGLCDVYDGYIKSFAMNQALRSMAPDIMICDEIGSADDISAIENAVNCGVTLIASVHASNEYELKRKGEICRLIKLGAFSKIVFLSDKNEPGRVIRICDGGVLLGA